jgi:hypothetical protein
LVHLSSAKFSSHAHSEALRHPKSVGGRGAAGVVEIESEWTASRKGKEDPHLPKAGRCGAPTGRERMWATCQQWKPTHRKERDEWVSRHTSACLMLN